MRWGRVAALAVLVFLAGVGVGTLMRSLWGDTGGTLAPFVAGIGGVGFAIAAQDWWHKNDQT